MEEGETTKLRSVKESAPYGRSQRYWVEEKDSRLSVPNAGGGVRCLVAASYADAMFSTAGSSPGPAQNEIPNGMGDSVVVCSVS
jgi:hypothetical protein